MPFERPIRRVIAALTGSETGLGAGGFQGFTFRMRDDGFHEEHIYRGMHPMLSKRLFLWRLKDLETERVPSAEEVYLYRVSGKDARLIALAEIRDLLAKAPADRPVLIVLDALDQLLRIARLALQLHAVAADHQAVEVGVVRQDPRDVGQKFNCQRRFRPSGGQEPGCFAGPRNLLANAVDLHGLAAHVGDCIVQFHGGGRALPGACKAGDRLCNDRAHGTGRTDLPARI